MVAYLLALQLLIGCTGAPPAGLPVPTHTAAAPAAASTPTLSRSGQFQPTQSIYSTAFPAAPTHPKAPLPTQTSPNPAVAPTLALSGSPTGAAVPGGARVIQFQPWELVTALAWSPDGRWLAVAAGDTIFLVSADGQTQVAMQTAGALSPGLAFSPDGRLLAAASRDGRLRVWQVDALPGMGYQPSLNLVFTLEAHKKGANSVAFSPDGNWVASGGNDAMAKVWDVQSGELVQSMIGGTFVVPALAFHPQGGTIAIVNGDTIRLREVSTGRMVAAVRGANSFYSLAFSPDGSLLAAGDGENSVYVWKTGELEGTAAQTWQAHQARLGSAAALVWAVAFHPDGAQLASGGGDGVVHLWSAGGEEIRSLAGHTRAVTCLAYHPDGSRLATGSLDATVRIWELPPEGSP